MEKTAVEWLVNELKESIGLKDLHTIEKAKQMFEQQIIDAHFAAQIEDIRFWNEAKQEALDYYNETFKTK